MLKVDCTTTTMVVASESQLSRTTLAECCVLCTTTTTTTYVPTVTLSSELRSFNASLDLELARKGGGRGEQERGEMKADGGVCCT